MRSVIKSTMVLLVMLLVSPAFGQAKKAKPVKVTGNIGLVDTEKNYMIVVTKDGKLVTIDFDNKTKVTKYVPQKASVKDLNLGTSVNATYKIKTADLEGFEFKVKAKKGE
jgi:hypothetical protein